MATITKLYIGSVDDAYESITDLKLRRCELHFEPLWAYTFPSNAALIAFVLAFGSNFLAENNTMLLPNHLKADAEAMLQSLDLSDSTDRCEMFIVRAWGVEDEVALDSAFG